MNNYENSNSQNEKLDEKKEEQTNDDIHQKTLVNKNESNINEEPKNKVTVNVEDNNKEMEKLNKDKTISSEHMNYLNDYYNSEEYNNNDDRPKNIITMNDIIGNAKKEININIMNESFNNFFPGKVSTRSYGPIKAYAANTNQGIVRDYNEDRVSIIININQPNFSKNKKANWPKASYFSIFDGHGGNKCAEFLRDNLLKLICDNDFFPTDIEKAIKFGFSEADRLFLEIAVKDGKLVDSSGSCGLILLIIDNKIYIANVGDSRCIISMSNGKIRKDVTRDHKPNYPYEKKRIISNGGKIYQTQTPLNQKNENNNNSNNSDESFTNNENINSNLILLGPHRVFPGSLSVSRTIGDAASKLSSLGGNPKVVISEPDIYCFELDKEDIDFIILGCDGIYDQLTSEEVIKCAWMMIDFSKKYNSKENINNNEKEEEEKDEIDLFTTCAHIVDFILKASMSRKSFDNVTCLIVAFKDLINDDLRKNNVNEVPVERKKEKNDKIEKPTNLEEKKETKIPRLIISKTTDLLMEDNKIENKLIGNNKKKINIDKIQIKSKEKDDKNNYKLNSNIKLFGNIIETPNNNINTGELSHRVISNNLLKEFKFKTHKDNENENIKNINNNKNDLSLSSAKIMKKSKSIESIIDRSNTNHNINNNTNKKLINNPMNNVNFINNSDEKHISTKKERLNISKKLFMNKKIKPLFIENKLNKNKYKNNTLRIATISPKNKNQSRIGGSLSKHGPVLSDLNLYHNKNINLKEINPITLTSNIPKITNINTITLKNSPKGKLSLNDLLSIGSNKIYSYRNKNGNKLKSLNKKSISFYNKCNFNDFVSNPKIGGEKISLQKNQISKFDLFNKKSENSTGSYVNIKNTNMGNSNKYQFSNDDKHKEKIERPINLCPIYQNDYKINNGKNNSKRYNGSNTKVKTLVHNLTENLLSQNKRIGIPALNGKNKIYNNINSIKKLNLI